MSNQSSFDVFLSHSSKDNEIVRAVAKRLQADGLRVWFDESEIQPGDNIPARIEEGLERSRVLVLCMSANAFGSEWAQLEAGTFRFRDPLNKERRFIPLRLDKTPIKGSLAQFRYVNWLPADREQEYAKLLEACRPPEAETAGAQTGRKFIQLGVTKAIFSYAFGPDGKRVLTGGEDRTVRLWDVEARRCLRVLRGHTNGVVVVAWSADRRRALSGGDTTLRLWDVEKGRCLRVFEGHTDDVHSVAWSADERRVLSTSMDHTLRLWDVETGRCLRVLQGHDDFVLSVAWSADQRYALSGSHDRTIRLWEVATGKCLRVLEGHTGHVLETLWSADKRRALSCAGDSTVRFWDVEAGRCLRVLEGHTDLVRSLAWSADERRALSGSNDNFIRLWDLDTGRCLCVIKGHQHFVCGIAWSGDQGHAFSGDIGGGICVWDLSEFAADAQAVETPGRVLPPLSDQVQYTNAKVLLVGESGVGKTGLTERLVHNRRPQRGPSTAGTWSTQWSLKDLPQKPGWEREVWLWDFGGQADQRLIHQLYLDRTALVLLMFNADRDSVLPGLREWQQALARSTALGRTDVSGRRPHRCRPPFRPPKGSGLREGERLRVFRN